MNKILIFAVVGLLVLSLIVVGVYIDSKENVYEYLSDGEYSAPLTDNQIKILNEEFEARQLQRVKE